MHAPSCPPRGHELNPARPRHAQNKPHTPLGHPQYTARRMQLSLPGLALAHQLYVALQAQGGGKLGTQALALVLERMNGMGVDQITEGGKR